MLIHFLNIKYTRLQRRTRRIHGLKLPNKQFEFCQQENRKNAEQMMEDLFPHRNHQEEKMGQDPREQKWEENFSLCQRTWVTTCPQTSPHFRENGLVSQTAPDDQQQRELLKCKFICTKIDECVPKLNFPIIMESTFFKLLTRYFLYLEYARDVHEAKGMCCQQEGPRAIWATNYGQIPGISRPALIMPLECTDNANLVTFIFIKCLSSEKVFASCGHVRVCVCGLSLSVLKGKVCVWNKCPVILRALSWFIRRDG